VILWVPHFSDRSAHIISQRSLKSGFYMIAMIAERFFSHRSQRSQQPYGNQPLFSVLFGCLPVRLSSIPLFICFNAISVTRQIVYMTVPFGSIIHSFMWFWPAQFMCLFLKYTKKCLNILSYRGTETHYPYLSNGQNRKRFLRKWSSWIALHNVKSIYYMRDQNLTKMSSAPGSSRR